MYLESYMSRVLDIPKYRANKDKDKINLVYPRAGGAKRRARVLIPPGYLHPGKRKH